MVRGVVNEHVGCQLKGINLRLGRFSGVHGESLRFCLSCLLSSTEWPDAQVGINEIIPQLTCSDCHLETSTQSPLPICPVCGSTKVKMTGFEPITLESVDLEEQEQPL